MIVQSIRQTLIGQLEQGSMARKMVDGFLTTEAILILYQRVKTIVLPLFSQKLPFTLSNSLDKNVKYLAGAASVAFVSTGRSYSNPTVIMLATAYAVNTFYTWWRPTLLPLSTDIKEIAPDAAHQNTEAFTTYLKPLKTMEMGKVSYVFAQTGLSLSYFAKCASKLFPDRKVFYIEKLIGQDELQVLLKTHPKAIVFSNQPGIFDRLTPSKEQTAVFEPKNPLKDALCCEIFSDEELFYARQGQEVIDLGSLKKENCLQQCDWNEDKAQKAFDVVSTLNRRQETIGLVTVDVLKQELKDEKVEEKAFQILRNKGLHPHQLIPIAHDLGLDYEPRSVSQIPSCLRVLGGKQKEGEDEILKAVKDDHHLVVTGISLNRMVDSVGQLNRRPEQIVYTLNMEPLLTVKKIEEREENVLCQRAVDHLLDFLWTKPQTILFLPALTNHLHQLLPLFPPETRILMYRKEPLKEGEIKVLENGFHYLNLGPAPQPAEALKPAEEAQ